MNIKNKMEVVDVNEEVNERKIFVSHVTIRQSISFLILRLIVLEVISATLIILFYSFFVPTGVVENIIGSEYGLYNTLLFITFIVGKTLVMTYIVIIWLNDYYEITPREVIHRTGLIFRKEEKQILDHIGSVEIQQGLLGRIFNYGNLILFNWVLEKNSMLYLIHNPRKYLRVLQNLLPQSNQKKSIIRDHIIEKERV